MRERDIEQLWYGEWELVGLNAWNGLERLWYGEWELVGLNA